uniref:Uncharacterized protein n=1 Tax=Hyaloperonospora arabidopsidis (strain Emoy2) TaxID=559515 RepID=M4BCP9_HYAAE
MANHLRRQQRFIDTMRSTFPKKSFTRWHSLYRVTSSLDEHRAEDLAHYSSMPPACRKKHRTAHPGGCLTPSQSRWLVLSTQWFNVFKAAASH